MKMYLFYKKSIYYIKKRWHSNLGIDMESVENVSDVVGSLVLNQTPSSSLANQFSLTRIEKLIHDIIFLSD
jgi:hypothetical protein